LRALAVADEGILGLIVGGSRGKGFGSDGSDYDVTVVVSDAREDGLRASVRDISAGNDFDVFTVDQFAKHARWGTPAAAHRYNYAHLRVELDRTGGELQRLVDEKGRVPESEVRGHIEASLDWFINQVYRSLKAARLGNRVGRRLEAAEGIRGYLQACFALHEGRLLPYYKYLEWELDRAPLDRLERPTDELLGLVFRVLDQGDPGAQQTLLRTAESTFRPRGYGPVFDSWGEALDWMLDFRPPK
jgi:hypothetical protein